MSLDSQGGPGESPVTVAYVGMLTGIRENFNTLRIGLSCETFELLISRVELIANSLDRLCGLLKELDLEVSVELVNHRARALVDARNFYFHRQQRPSTPTSRVVEVDVTNASDHVASRADELSRALEELDFRISRKISEAMQHDIVALVHTDVNDDGAQESRVSETSLALTRWAVKVLPAQERARYYEEFQSELFELAATQQSWWRQLQYAIRLLVRAAPLRYQSQLPARRSVQ